MMSKGVMRKVLNGKGVMMTTNGRNLGGQNHFWTTKGD